MSLVKTQKAAPNSFSVFEPSVKIIIISFRIIFASPSSNEIWFVGDVLNEEDSSLLPSSSYFAVAYLLCSREDVFLGYKLMYIWLRAVIAFVRVKCRVLFVTLLLSGAISFRLCRVGMGFEWKRVSSSFCMFD
ncbi:hypothetical protein AVEN_184586-1 [Araneus ventricosus]|uniref:Uncharacterized protein n=1 Tax=Araneus ventricosus TaxID=182803 RepID=A0A4Y2G7J4_ARAVE|nr:hypothetical protein AVEN_184586-1 [Araneus ventricosus]